MALGSIGCTVYTVHFCTTLGSVGFKVSRSQGLGFASARHLHGTRMLNEM